MTEYRTRFKWISPTVNTYRAADPRPLRIALNRYPGVVIGIALQLGRRVIGLRWKGTPR